MKIQIWTILPRGVFLKPDQSKKKSFYKSKKCNDNVITLSLIFSADGFSLAKSFETMVENKNIKMLASFINTDAISR